MLTSRAYPALIKIAREEGVGAWYRGFAPKVLRLGPGGGVLLLGESGVWDFCAKLMVYSGRGSIYRFQESPRSPIRLDHIDFLHASWSRTASGFAFLIEDSGGFIEDPGGEKEATFGRYVNYTIHI
jgi:hypothetical protein